MQEKNQGREKIKTSVLTTSLTLHRSIEAEAFPLLKIKTCISEAYDSRNGPRFCAQDSDTGSVYQIRCVGLDTRSSQPGTPRSHARTRPTDKKAPIRRHRERIEAVLNFAATQCVPDCVSFPIDIYLYDSLSSGTTCVAAVEPFAGLSLGDIVRSGWNSMKEHVFMEILNVVEQFGYASSLLPPHGNLSADAVQQLLTTRDGASEALNKSRWVINDWHLTYDADNVAFNAASVISDLEFMLHSAFSQLNINSDMSCTFLSRTQIESRIDEVIDRIRCSLFKISVGNLTPVHADESAHVMENNELPDEKFNLGPSRSNSPPKTYSQDSPLMERGIAPLESKQMGIGVKYSLVGQDMVNLEAVSTLRDKIIYHQNELRKDQQLANRYRRRTAMLPPLPRSNSYYTSVLAEYDLKEEESCGASDPLPRVRLAPSLLLTSPSRPSTPVSSRLGLPQTQAQRGTGGKEKVTMRSAQNNKPRGRRGASPKVALGATFSKMDEENSRTKDREGILKDLLNALTFLGIDEVSKKDKTQNLQQEVFRHKKVSTINDLAKNCGSLFKSNENHHLLSSASLTNPAHGAPSQTYTSNPRSWFQSTSSFYARMDMGNLLSRETLTTVAAKPTGKRRRLLKYESLISRHPEARGNGTACDALFEPASSAQAPQRLNGSQSGTGQKPGKLSSDASGLDIMTGVNLQRSATFEEGTGFSIASEKDPSRCASKSGGSPLVTHSPRSKQPELRTTSWAELDGTKQLPLQALPREAMRFPRDTRLSHPSTSEDLPPQHITKVPATARDFSAPLLRTTEAEAPQTARLSSAYPPPGSYGGGLDSKGAQDHARNFKNFYHVDAALDFVSRDCPRPPAQGERAGAAAIPVSARGLTFVSSRGSYLHPLSYARLNLLSGQAVSSENTTTTARLPGYTSLLRGGATYRDRTNSRNIRSNGTRIVGTGSVYPSPRNSISPPGQTTSPHRRKRTSSAQFRQPSASRKRISAMSKTELGVSQNAVTRTSADAVTRAEKLQSPKVPKKLLFSQVRLSHGACIKIVRFRPTTSDVEKYNHGM